MEASILGHVITAMPDRPAHPEVNDVLSGRRACDRDVGGEGSDVNVVSGSARIADVNGGAEGGIHGIVIPEGYGSETPDHSEVGRGCRV